MYYVYITMHVDTMISLYYHITTLSAYPERFPLQSYTIAYYVIDVSPDHMRC